MYLNQLANHISYSSLDDLANNNNTKECLHFYPYPHPKLLSPQHNINNTQVDGQRSTQTSLTRSTFSLWYHRLGNYRMEQHFADFPEISEWLKLQPLSILQLDAADRIVLFIAGKSKCH